MDHCLSLANFRYVFFFFTQEPSYFSFFLRYLRQEVLDEPGYGQPAVDISVLNFCVMSLPRLPEIVDKDVLIFIGHSRVHHSRQHPGQFFRWSGYHFDVLRGLCLRHFLEGRNKQKNIEGKRKKNSEQPDKSTSTYEHIQTYPLTHAKNKQNNRVTSCEKLLE